MKALAFALLLLQARELPWEPAPRAREYPWMSTAHWRERHAGHVRRAKEGNCDLLFVGDSITEGWGNNAAWRKHFAPRRAVNLGIGGDTTQNVLWRLSNGAVDGLSPKAVVLLIGTNNFGLHGDSPEDVAKGVAAVVASLRERLPSARLLLMAVLPRDEKPDTGMRRRIGALNAQLARLEGPSVRFLDIGAKFLAADGTLPKDLLPDFLHLSEKGYAIWAEAVDPILADWLK